MRSRLEMHRVEAPLMTAGSVAGLHVVGVIFAVLIAGCAALEKTPVSDPVQNNVTNAAAIATAMPTVPADKTPPRATTAVDTVAPAPTATLSAASGSTSQPAANAAAPSATAPAKAPVSPAPAGPLAKKEAPPSGPLKSAASTPLDLKSLETRLKETKAIGVFTKIALKNQVDDLLNQFRAYYQGHLKITLAELRRPYEMLLQKVLALLQDGDPPLAGAIVASREALWGILADPAKFATI
jgi:hypothetical protein